MNKFQLHFISFFLRALLPPRIEQQKEEDEDQQNYYAILGITQHATLDEIRKAYKKKSLQYHPDKIAQFSALHSSSIQPNGPSRLTTREETSSANFVRIKEAYETLSHPKKRDAYDILGEEGAKIVNHWDEGLEIHALLHNLSRASFMDRCKLFFLVMMILSMFLLGPVLISVKVDALVNSTSSTNSNPLGNVPWVVLLIPFWILNVFWLSLLVMVQSWFSFSRVASIFALEILLALRWDGTIGVAYSYVLIPLYLYHACNMIEGVWTMIQVRRDVSRMITLDYLEKYVLPEFNLEEDGHDASNHDPNNEMQLLRRSYEDLNEEERAIINEMFIILSEDTVEDAAVQEKDKGGSDIDENNVDNESSLNAHIQDQLKLMLDVTNSAEYKHASTVRYQAISILISLLLFRVPFLVLLVLQLSEKVNWNWNVVFVPIWMEILVMTLSSCWNACCASSVHSSGNEFEVINESDVGNVTGDKEEDPNHNILVSTGEDNVDHVDSLDLKDNQPQEELVQIVPLASAENNQPVPRDTYEHDTEYEALPPNVARNNDTKPALQQNDPPEYEQSKSTDAKFDSQEAENHARSLGSCCYYIMIIMGLSLFLVKLNRATDDGNDEMDYSSFWVLMPLLIVSFIVLFLCGCFIFAVPENMVLHKEDSGDSRNDGEYQQVYQNVQNESHGEDGRNKSLLVGGQDEERGDMVTNEGQEDSPTTGNRDIDDLD